MQRLIYLLLLISVLSCKQAQEVEIQNSEEAAPSWKSLFNGKDLKGWIPKIAGYPLGENFGNTFRVENGLLSIRYDAYGDNFEGRFGGLYFEEKLKDYRIRAEYRFVGETAPGAPEWGYKDSGLQFHSQSPQSLEIDQAFPVCLEFNFHGGNGTDERPIGALCANGTSIEVAGIKNETYCTAPFVKETIHGDEWVAMEVEIRNGKITHYVNGKEVLSASNPTLDPENKIAKTLIKDGNISLTEGYISFQSNSHPIDFKKIELLVY